MRTETRHVDRWIGCGLPELTAGIASALGLDATDVRIVERLPSPYATSARTEIVTARTAEGQVSTLFVKHDAELESPSYGHRGNLVYETLVHREVLSPLGMRTARLLGTFWTGSGRFSAVFEFLPWALRVSHVRERSAMPMAARWIGELHRRSARLAAGASLSLHRYDTGYYVGWVRRAMRFAQERGEERWLGELGHRVEGVLRGFAEEPGSVIHGEYYPMNVLVHDGRVYPVDWETAAIAPGEIDLAALIDGWPPDVAARCTLAYARARWAGASPGRFERRLLVARMYLLFRWLGDRPEWARDARAPGRYEQLRSAVAELGLIGRAGALGSSTVAPLGDRP